jgi:hypothetical protein
MSTGEHGLDLAEVPVHAVHVVPHWRAGQEPHLLELGRALSLHLNISVYAILDARAFAIRAS